MFKSGQRYLMGLLLLLAMMTRSEATDMLITGVLIDEPCSLNPADGNVNVEFGDLIDHDLYRSNRIDKPFTIELNECDSDIITTLTIKFSGNSSSQQPGLLALDSSSQAYGVAIGIENDGVLIPINSQQGATFPFQHGSNKLTFNAYVQADPAAIRQKKIGLGPFMATATFVFEYH